MSPSIIILANGEQARWHGTDFKQLVEVDGVPILLDTLEKFGKGNIPIVATRHPELAKLVNDFKFYSRVYNPNPTPTPIHTILAARGLWGEQRTIILLGDVFYTAACAEAILSNTDPIVFHGRWGKSFITGKPHSELWSMSWNANENGRAIACLQASIDDIPNGNRASLWEPYRWLAGIWMQNLGAAEPEPRKYLITVDDFTEDFDGMEDYEQFIEMWEKRG